MKNGHGVKSVGDLETYVQRLEGLQNMLDQVRAKLVRRQEAGVLPPRFVFPLVIEDCRNVIRGVPFDGGPEDNVLWADFNEKLGSVEGLDERRKQDLLRRAELALLTKVARAMRI